MVEAGYGTIEGGSIVEGGRKVVEDVSRGVKDFFKDDGGNQTRTGLKPGVLAAMAYSLGWVSGVILYFLENENVYVKYHASQSIVVFMGLWALSSLLETVAFLTFGLSGILIKIIGLVSLVLWVFLMVKAYLGGREGDVYRVPFVDAVADRLAA